MEHFSIRLIRVEELTVEVMETTRELAEAKAIDMAEEMTGVKDWTLHTDPLLDSVSECMHFYGNRSLFK